MTKNKSSKLTLTLSIVAISLVSFLGGNYFANFKINKQNVALNSVAEKIPLSLPLEKGETEHKDKESIATTTETKKIGKEIFDGSKSWSEVTVEYPLEEKLVEKKIMEQYKNWEKEIDVSNIDTENTDKAKYNFTANYEKIINKDTTTYLYNIYSFSGGAHGSTNKLPITLDNETHQEIKVEQIIPENKIEQISKFVYDNLKKQKRDKMMQGAKTKKEKQDVERMLSNDEMLKVGTDPSRDNYNTAWPEGEFINIYFGQYQVAPYSMGDFVVNVPRKLLE